MSEIISLAEFRSRISIIELATANGYTPNKKHSCQKYPVFDNPNTGDRIYIVNPNNSSNQGYVNVNDDLDKGTLVDFVRKRLNTDFRNFNRTDRSEFSNINAALYNHLSRPEPERKTIAAHFNDIAGRNKIGQTDSRFNIDLLDVKHLHNTYFLLSRGIKPTTIHHQNFAGAIYNVENNGIINTAFPYYDHTGAVIGMEIRNQNFKQHAENSKKSEGVWHSNPPEKVDHILVTESAIDALSYHQLHQPKNTLYISVGGNLSMYQVGTLLNYASSLSGAKDARILLGFDNDKEGAKYDLRFLIESNKHHLPGASIAASKTFLNLEIPVLSKETAKTVENLIVGVKEYTTDSRDQIKKMADPLSKTNVSNLLFSTSIKDNIFNIQIPGSLQAISFFNQQLIKVLGIDKKFGLEKALSKDFNDDLKMKAPVKQREPEKKGLQV